MDGTRKAIVWGAEFAELTPGFYRFESQVLFATARCEPPLAKARQRTCDRDKTPLARTAAQNSSAAFR